MPNTSRLPTATAMAVTSVVLLTFIISLPLYDATSYLPVSNPRFGACQTRETSMETSEFAYCALRPSDCTLTANSPYEYVPPHLIRSTTQCNKPHQVTIGRCTSNVDKNICSAFSESCAISSEFQPRDDTCKLVQTPSDDAVTRYPQCRKPQYGKADLHRCVLGPDDCVDGENFLETVRLPWGKSCHCHQVPTGMCHMKGITPVTADASFCAVGSDDCPDSYSWMSSAQLLNMADPPQKCMLCRRADIMGTEDVHESVVESGGCYADDASFLRCALESSECNIVDGEVFMSSMQMYEMGHVPCATDNMAGGECTSSLDSVGCTNRAEACQQPRKFKPKDTCTLHTNTLNSREETWFGGCRDTNQNRWCVWGSAECDVGAGDIWSKASNDQTFLDGCQCEDVQTGACRKDGGGAGGKGYYCAVSKLGCDDPSSYVSSREAIKQLGLDCRLCHPRRKVFMPIQPEKNPVRAPSISEPSSSTKTGQKSPVGVPSNPELSSSTKTGQYRDPSLAFILGTTLGTMAVLTSLAVFAHCRRSKSETFLETEWQERDSDEII